MGDISSRVVMRLAFLLLCLPGLAAATVYIPELKTTATLSADGSAHVVQELTCQFDGKRRYMRLYYPVRGQDVELNRITERSAQRSGPVEGLQTWTDESEGFVMEWAVNAIDEHDYAVNSSCVICGAVAQARSTRSKSSFSRCLRLKR